MLYVCTARLSKANETRIVTKFVNSRKNSVAKNKQRAWLEPCPLFCEFKTELVRESLHGAAGAAISDDRRGCDRDGVSFNDRISQRAETLVAARG